MVQNMRAYFILHVITIKCINCIKEKTELSCKLHRPTLISTKILGVLSLATNIKQEKTTIKNCKKILRGGKKMASCYLGVAVATPCHPIATGLEFASNEFEEFLEEKGILHQKSVLYCPEQNGVAERMGRILVEKARAMLKGASLSTALWAEAVASAAYVRNRSTTSSLANITPFEVWWNKKPSVKHLRIFGCKAYSHIPKKFPQKLDNRAVKCIFLGYSTCSKAYRLWSLDKRSLAIRRNVIFDKSSFGADETKAEQLTDESTVNSIEISDCTDQSNENTSIDEHEEEVVPVRRTEKSKCRTTPR